MNTKATGIVRRIDDLGRVVIPKEIRRVMRIREGEPLEIYTDNDGEIIFKKYSPVGEMTRFAEQYAEVLHRASGYQTVITDRDTVVAVAGGSKRDLIGKPVADSLETLMESRVHYVVRRDSENLVSVVDGVDKTASVVSPIVSGGDVVGSVCMVREEGKPPSETDVKLIQTAAQFIGRQMEE